MKNWIKITLYLVFIIIIISVGIKIKIYLNNKTLPDPKIIIKNDGINPFISKKELFETLKTNNFVFKYQKIKELDIESIEKFIRSISHVKSVNVFQKINGQWEINIELRKPIARIFNKFGETYYLDDQGNTMHTTRTHTARVLVFNGEIPDKADNFSVKQIINNDSLINILKLDDIYRISNYVCEDTLFQSMVSQVHVDKNGDFIIIPMIGDQKIIFGKANSNKVVKSKFDKLKTFYTEAIEYEGWRKYKEINLKYKGQIVCKKKELIK